MTSGTKVKINNIIKENYLNFDGWIETINTYNKANTYSPEYKADDLTHLTKEMCKVLENISDLFIQYGSFKDSFDNSSFYLLRSGPSLIIKSNKTGITWNFGIDDTGFYLNTFLFYSENLRHMRDPFFEDLLMLNDFGKFEIVKNESFRKEITQKHPEIFANNQSAIFKLLRNYFVSVLENQDSILSSQFQIQWPYEMDFSLLVENSCQAFKVLYSLNYQLWKFSKNANIMK